MEEIGDRGVHRENEEGIMDKFDNSDIVVV